MGGFHPSLDAIIEGLGYAAPPIMALLFILDVCSLFPCQFYLWFYLITYWILTKINHVLPLCHWNLGKDYRFGSMLLKNVEFDLVGFQVVINKKSSHQFSA